VIAIVNPYKLYVLLEQTIETMQRVADTGGIDGGKLFVLELTQAVRICIGEQGGAAL
jgi:nitrogen regulatory protein PII